eukprot:s1930_g18.t1
MFLGRRKVWLKLCTVQEHVLKHAPCFGSFVLGLCFGHSNHHQSGNAFFTKNQTGSNALPSRPGLMSAVPALVLPSVGFVLHDGGRIAEATCNGAVASGKVAFNARGAGATPAVAPPVRPSRLSMAGNAAVSRPSKSRVRGEQILGIPHSVPLRTVGNEPTDTANGQQAGQANEEDQIDACLKMAAEGEGIRMTMAFQRMSHYFAELKPGSLVLEVGSRAGDMTLMFAERFPDLYILPTEGTGEASPSLFMLLQERLALRRDQKRPMSMSKKRSKKRAAADSQARSRILPPRHLEASLPKSWRNKMTSQDISCIFCVNVLHYMSPLGVDHLLQGCSDHLPMGGYLLICGPFFNNGKAADSLLIYDAALRDFAAASERKLHWGCHDVMQIVASGSKVGFSLVAHEETDGVGGHSWILIVLRRERSERYAFEICILWCIGLSCIVVAWKVTLVRTGGGKTRALTFGQVSRLPRSWQTCGLFEGMSLHAPQKCQNILGLAQDVRLVVCGCRWDAQMLLGAMSGDRFCKVQMKVEVGAIIRICR